MYNMKVLVILAVLAVSVDSRNQCDGKRCKRRETCVPTAGPECTDSDCPTRSLCLDEDSTQESCEGKQKDCSDKDKECVNVREDESCEGPSCSLKAKCLPTADTSLPGEDCDDKTCAKKEKCVKTVSPDCTHTLCESKYTCVTKDDYKESCEKKGKECNDPQKGCVNVLLECRNEPCPIERKCLPILDQCGGITCAKNEKCVETVPHDCEDSTCPTQEVCVKEKDAKKTCEDKECNKEEKVCLNILTVCGKIDAKCLPIIDSCGGESCKKREKCLETVFPDCTNALCTKEQTCIKDEHARKSCEETRPGCERQAECLNVRIECRKAPCPIEAVCLPKARPIPG